MAKLGRDDTEQAGTLFNDWALALIQMGRPLEAEKLFRRAIEIGRTDDSDSAVSPTLLTNYAAALKDLGRLTESADYAERATKRAKQTGNQVAFDQSLLQRARAYRDLHELDRAEAMLAEVEPRLRKALPPGHYAFASLASEKSLVALARGDTTTAVALADQSINIMEASIKAGGQGKGMLPTLLTRRSAVYLGVGKPELAESDAARALSLLQPFIQGRSYSSKAGWAYLAEARAMLAEGKVEEARSAARSGSEQLQMAIGPNHPDARAALQLAGSSANAR